MFQMKIRNYEVTDDKKFATPPKNANKKGTQAVADTRVIATEPSDNEDKGINGSLGAISSKNIIT